MAPRLSVVMAVYNGQKFLRETLDSILAQSFLDYELIIMDDGSTDDSWAVLSEYAARDSRIALHRHVRNQGVTRAMNAIFPKAVGQYIVRHDADDLSTPDRFAQQVAFLDARPEIGLVGAWVENIDEQGGPFRPKTFFPLELDNDAIQAQLLDGNPLGQGAVMFRRQLLDRLGLYDERLDYSEDYDLWLRIAEVTHLAKLPQFLYKYRQHGSNVSRVYFGIQMLHFAEALEKALYRRFGENIADVNLRRGVHQYLNAANILLAEGQLHLVAVSLAKAIRLYPRVFGSEDTEVPFQILHNGPGLIDAAFKHLPANLYFAALKRRFIARLYLREVFLALAQGDFDRVDTNLWPGLRANPAWLLNRGVLSIIRRRWVGRPRPI